VRDQHTVDFIASRRALERPSWIALTIPSRCSARVAATLTKGASTARARRPKPLIEQQGRLLGAFGLVDGSELIDEQPAAVDTLVRLRELLDERPLRLGEGVGAASEHEAGALEPDRLLGVLPAQPLPVLPAERLEGLAGEPDDVEGIGADDGVGGAGADHLAPGAVQVRGDRLEQRAALLAELVEEGVRTARLLPGRAQTIRPVSWQTTQSR
jgi:hypothetical protein